MREADVRRLQEQLKAFHRRQRKEWSSPEGLTQTAVRVIGSIARQPEGSQPGLVSDDLGLASSNVAAALRELESRGLVTRTRDVQDTRRTNLHLTVAGEALVASSRDERDDWLSRAIDAVLDDNQQAVLLEAGLLLEKLSQYDVIAGSTDGVAS
ncbi:MarR family winged helix-turn-helix transcriptional regulator [Curtobacterium sp. ISL-83]|uniref:MarR family winged helix-turn-helix transcriptional regulator n=1 Tax=Curtobacterium sp. ISL-83 TaxID=2819145 RepID=UPI001BE9E488|nr:MarR family transcriptional regulator [Curtobacterium sp. ISL-83]MBT2504270.1 MarR family transcriptional regulator [Curtobacterium sp. ISL-83]